MLVPFGTAFLPLGSPASRGFFWRPHHWPRCQLAPVRRNQNVERLPRLWHVTDPGREFADALERMPRGEDHRKKRPAHLHLARQINAVHDAAKADVSEDHGVTRIWDD